MRRAVLIALLLLVAGAVTAAPAPFAKPERRSALEQFRGEWEIVAERREVIYTTGRGAGVRHVWFSRLGHTVTVLADRLVWRIADRPLRADAARAGKAGIELTDAQSGRARGASFRRDGDTVHLTLTDAERPEMAFLLRRKR